MMILNKRKKINETIAKRFKYELDLKLFKENEIITRYDIHLFHFFYEYETFKDRIKFKALLNILKKLKIINYDNKNKNTYFNLFSSICNIITIDITKNIFWTCHDFSRLKYIDFDDEEWNKYYDFFNANTSDKYDNKLPDYFLNYKFSLLDILEIGGIELWIILREIFTI